MSETWEIGLDLKYCYGIESLKETLKIEPKTDPCGVRSPKEQNLYLIYASNGLMKSSLAKTVSDAVEGKDISSKDKIRIISDQDYKREIKLNNELIEDVKDTVLIFKSYELEEENLRASDILITNSDLKKEYNEELKSYKKTKKEILKKLYLKLKNLQKQNKTDFEVKEILRDEITKSFGFSLNKIEVESFILQDNNHSYFDFENIIQIDFDLIFSDNISSKLNNEILNKIKEHLKNVKLLTEESDYFNDKLTLHKMEEIIGDEKISILLDDYELKNKKTGKKLKNKEELKEFYEYERRRVFENIDVIKNLNDIKDAFKDKKSKIMISQIIETTRNIDFFMKIKTLKDYKKAKKQYLIDLIEKIKKESNWEKEKSNHLKFEEKYKKEAESKMTIWEEVIKTFNNRFQLPVEIKIKNKIEAVLGIEKPEVEICHLDNKDFKDENIIRESLSTGEKKALYLLKMLFLIEELQIKVKEINKNIKIENKELRKNGEEKKLRKGFLLLDDIADSFDYKNKYALIEYITDFSRDTTFKTLILTHSFDFFTSISKRTSIGSNKSIALLNEDNELNIVNLSSDLSLNDVSKKISDMNDLFLSIPISRALLEYRKKDEKVEEQYTMLTKMLHYKESTLELTMEDVINQDIISESIAEEEGSIKNSKSNYIMSLKKAKYLQSLFQKADEITETHSSKNPLANTIIKDKIILCMAIRIKSEKIIKNLLGMKLNDDKWQLGTLFELFVKTEDFKANFNKKEAFELFQRASIMVPELIHIDLLNHSLMMDLSIHVLKKLYKDINDFESEIIIGNKNCKINSFNKDLDLLIENISSLNNPEEYLPEKRRKFFSEQLWFVQHVIERMKKRNLKNHISDDFFVLVEEDDRVYSKLLFEKLLNEANFYTKIESLIKNVIPKNPKLLKDLKNANLPRHYSDSKVVPILKPIFDKHKKDVGLIKQLEDYFNSTSNHYYKIFFEKFYL